MPITDSFPSHTPTGIVETFSRGRAWFPLDSAYENCDQYVSEFTIGTVYEDAAFCRYKGRYDECFCIDVKSPYYTSYMTKLAQRGNGRKGKQAEFSFPDGIFDLLATTYGTWDLEKGFNSCEQNAYAYITEEDGVLRCYGTGNPNKCDCRLVPYDENDPHLTGKEKQGLSLMPDGLWDLIENGSGRWTLEEGFKNCRRNVYAYISDEDGVVRCYGTGNPNECHCRLVPYEKKGKQAVELSYPDGILHLMERSYGRWTLERAFKTCEENAYAYMGKKRGELRCKLDSKNRCRCIKY